MRRPSLPFCCTQAPLPLSELGSSSPHSALFIPFLRDALFQVFIDRSTESRHTHSSSLFRPVLRLHDSDVPQTEASVTPQPAAPALEESLRGTVATVLKVMGGRLLLQLHSRAARRQDVLDSWFHARNLAHSQFRRGMLQRCCSAVGDCAEFEESRLSIIWSESYVWDLHKGTLMRVCV